MRRTLIIILGILALVGIVLFFTRSKTTTDSTKGTGIFQGLFSPRNDAVSAIDGSGTEISSNNIASVDLPNNSAFKKVSPSAVAGYTVFSISHEITIPSVDGKSKPTKQTITDHYVRYVSRANGYVYEIKNDSIPTQISNIYIPDVYEATFADNNKTAVLRFLRSDDRTVATHTVPIPEPNPDGTRSQLPGTYLPDGITSLAVSPDTKWLARVTHNSGNGIISLSDSKNSNKRELLVSAFNEWLVLWGAKDIYLQTKATYSANGFLYRLDTANKRLIKVLGDIPGLTASISPKGTYILYSESVPDSFTTSIFTVKNGEKKQFGLKILPEKCAWLKNEDLICAGSESITGGNYPDDWYSGVVMLGDGLYKINTGINILETLDNGTYGYDAINLFADESESLLYFIDKTTGILWRFGY